MFTGQAVLSSFSLLLVFALTSSRRFSGHTVLSSFILLLVFALTSFDVSPITLDYLSSVYC